MNTHHLYQPSTYNSTIPSSNSFNPEDTQSSNPPSRPDDNLRFPDFRVYSSFSPKPLQRSCPPPPRRKLIRGASHRHWAKQTNKPPSLFLHTPPPPPDTARMDSLVAKYSRPAYDQNESFEDQDELMNPMANLNLKFAMPPIAQVRLFSCARLPFTTCSNTNSASSLALLVAPSCH